MFKSKNIFKEVKRLALEIKVSAKDFFLSEHFIEYLSNTGEFMTSRYKRPIRLRVEYEPKSGAIAYTDGDMIYINGANPLSDFYKNLNQKFHCWLGIFFHEVGHILFLDFPKLHEALDAVNEGKWWPKVPDVEYLPLIDEIDEYQRKGAGPIIARIIANLSNIIADVHDERAMVDKFGPLVEKSLMTSSYAMQETSKNLEDNIEDGMNDLSLLFGLILNYIRFDEVFMAKEDYENEHVKRLLSVIPFVDEARDTDSMEERFENINQIVLTIWPVIKDVIDKEEEKREEEKKEKGEGGESEGKEDGSGAGLDAKGGSSGGDMESALGSILKELGAVSESTSTATASGGTTPVESDDYIDGSAPAKDFDSLEKEMKEEKAEIALEKERVKAETEEIREIEKGALHSGISVNYRRKTAVTSAMKEAYNAIAAEVKPYVKTLVRLIMPELKDKRQGGKNYGAIYGNKFESRSIARTDGRYFSKRKLPTDSPRLAVGVLVDESGSMNCGNRAIMARKAAILLEMFTAELDIPTLICGHSTEGRNDFSLYSYAEPNKIDRNDKYRLADIKARSENRDGLALKIMCERMMKMDEEIKLLIVISDGAPCDSGYGGPTAEREMKEICREYRKKGITIIAAAIGNDRDAIQRIYEKGFLDISDLSKLPKTLVGLIKKDIR